MSKSLLKNLLPGPVTLIFKRKACLNPELNPGLASVGVRIPDHDFIQQLCVELGEPIALTSANVSDAGSTVDINVSRRSLVRLVE